MQYRHDISLIGYGCMRFSRNGAIIDYSKAEKEVLHAIELGVNYFDTAYTYPGNEEILGRIVSKNNIRSKINIATKLPQYYVKTSGAIEKYFNEQLSRLRTDYIDYYLMHMLTDISSWEKLVKLGIIDWIDEKKKSGQIKKIGFSFHGNTDMFIKILEAYNWEFCQIQYNYMDEFSQGGRKGLELAQSKNIPVIIMEPLRGGKLVDLLPDTAKTLIANNSHGYSAAEWSFRWLMQQSGVSCVLSGMNSIEMLEENVKIASEVKPGEFTPEDFNFINEIRNAINAKIKVNCTACGYCMPCPHGVDIPGVFRCYNVYYTDNHFSALREYVQMHVLKPKPSVASACVSCGACVRHCPQSINIPFELKNASKKLDILPVRLAKWGIQRFKLW